MQTSTLLRGCAIAALASCATAASADDSIGSNRLEFVKVKSDVAEILQRTRPSEPHSVPVPKFAVKSANNNFILTIGGVVSPILGFDFGNNLYRQDGAGINFVTQAIPVPALRGHKGDFYVNATANTMVDMQIVGLANTSNEIAGYVKLGTDGLTNQVKFKRAYVTYRGITAGVKPTLLQDNDACQPPTIDPEGPCGLVGATAYGVEYRSRDYNGFRFAAALEMPSFYSSNGIYRGKDYAEYDNKQVADYGDAEQMVPDIPMWVEYTFSPNNRVRLSAILRTFSYRDLLDNKTRHREAWGLMLSGNLSPASPLVFYYQAAYGKGIGNYIQDIAGLPVSFVPDDERPGHMTATPMAGFTLGASYQPNSRLQFDLVGSHTRMWDAGAYCRALDPSQNYRGAWYVAANCFVNITSYLQWGIEYLWGYRRTWDHTGAHDSRLQTQLAFSF